jgi:hypothetical protein
MGFCKNGAACTFAHGATELQGALNPEAIELEDEVCLPLPLPARREGEPEEDHRQEDYIFTLIINNMKKMLSNSPEAIIELEFAEKNLHNGNLAIASEIVSAVMSSESRTEKEKENYRKIRSNAHILYVNHIPQHK